MAEREIMTPVATQEALANAQILAMRSMSDNVAQLGRGVERLATEMHEVRDKVISLESQDLKATILSIRTEFLEMLRQTRVDAFAAVAELRADHGERLKDIDVAIDAAVVDRTAIKVDIAKVKGAWVPIAALGSAFLAGALTFIASWASGVFGGGGIHHP